ncbi:adenylate/guanylate cyclase domain-containing protein [candidate division CSSED10-310 bacterium]|uniref:Adenylate/guanylate cyclase domain-containing protein n=1 Tax=candidate division CSSED10-310 bacterium TaxID=2855610 RepID=A0ABV6Z022_UNCC1
MGVQPQSLVPTIITDLDREKPWSDWVAGSVLFADVSGFTPMSEVLSELGAEGAEILTDILNRYFNDMISMVNTFGGQVMKFGGDAILCFFPGSDTLLACLNAAWKMQQAMSKFQQLKTPVKRFSLKMKIGIARGDVLIAGVGDPVVRCDYVFAGEPVDLTSDAEHKAKAGDIIYTGAEQDLHQHHITFSTVAADFFRIQAVPDISIKAETVKSCEAGGNPYVMTEIYDMVAQGYDRHIGTLQSIVPAFFQFSGFKYTKDAFDLPEFHTYFTTVMRITHRYFGRLNRISMGDKGSTFFILFGSPRSLEKKEQLACAWALDLVHSLKEHFPALPLRIGMNSGRVFSGLVGGNNRFDFTVMGDTVNLAARLMQGAHNNQILISETVYEKGTDRFGFEFIGSRRFKGKKEPLPVYAVKERKQNIQLSKSDSYFSGRSAEIRHLKSVLDKVCHKEPALVALEGVPGVGKSFLAHHILNHLDRQKWNLVVGQGDVTLQSHLYAPWSSCLSDFLFDSSEPSLSDIRTLLCETDPDFEKYLPWHADFFQVPCSDELPSYDEETKKKLFHHQLSIIILNQITNQPTIFFFDDLHWFDSLSLELLNALLDSMTDHPLLILATTRPQWPKENFIKRSTCQLIGLSEMDIQSINAIAGDFLADPVRDDLLNLLHHHARGNPFFTVNFLKYLQTNKLIEKRLGLWTLKTAAVIKKTLTSEEIIIADLERLSLVEKMHLRFASCLGPTFSKVVLKKSLGSRFRVCVWEALCHKKYFQQSLEPDFYSFQHALVQDTIYHSIPNRQRKLNHRQIGITIEKVFVDEINKWYPNLADNFFLAAHKQKAKHYSLLAGKLLFEKMSFVESAHYLQNAFDLLKNTSDSQKWEVGLLLAQNLNYVGKLDDSLLITRRLRALSRLHNRPDVYRKTCLLQFDGMSKKNDLSYLRYANRLINQEQKMDEASVTNIKYYIGIAFFRLGMLQKARKYFQEVVDTLDDSETIISSYGYLAAILKKNNQFEEAFHIINKGINRALHEKKFYKQIGLLMEKANIYTERGDYHQAQKLNLDLLKECEKMGEIYRMGIILLNLGFTYALQNQLDNAKMYYQEALSYFTRIGNRDQKGFAFNHLGTIAYHQADFAQAYDYYLAALHENEQTGNILVEELYYNLAEVCLQMNEAAKARDWFSKFRARVEVTNIPVFRTLYAELKPQIEALTE